MNNKLQVIVDEQGLAETDVAKMVEAFGGPFEEAGLILANYKDIKITDVSQTDNMAKAREMRLALKKARTTVENNRKELKADIVKQGRAIDTIARYVKEEIEPAEEYLELQEKFIELKNAKEAEELKAQRIEKLMQYTSDISVYNLDVMTKEQFESLFTTLKNSYEAEQKRVADEAKAQEEERKAEEKRIAEQAKENARLKKEAESKEAEREAERKAEQAKLDKIQAEKNAEIKAEREKREAIEAENKEKQLQEKYAKEQFEAKEREALLAPDKQKLIVFAQGLDIVRSARLPAVKTNKAQELINYIDDELKRLSEYLIKEAKEL